MKFVHILVLIAATIFDSIGLSSQSGSSPKSESTLDVPPGRPLESPERNHFPERSVSPVEPPIRARSRSPSTGGPPRARLISPTTKLPDPNGFCGIEQMKFIRLIPYKSQRTFELRKYTFPVGKQIVLRIGKHKYEPIPTGEQIVLSTSDGEVFAILESFDLLAGIYTYVTNQSERRARINMLTGNVTPLTREEVNGSPVGLRRPIKSAYLIKNLNRM